MTLPFFSLTIISVNIVKDVLSESSLTQRIITYIKEGLYQCKNCQKYFAQNSGLETHKRNLNNVNIEREPSLTNIHTTYCFWYGGLRLTFTGLKCRLHGVAIVMMLDEDVM